MKWKDIKLDRDQITLAARQCGKTSLSADLFEKYMDWISRGRPPDEEVPAVHVTLLKVEH